MRKNSMNKNETKSREMAAQSLPGSMPVSDMESSIGSENGRIPAEVKTLPVFQGAMGVSGDTRICANYVQIKDVLAEAGKTSWSAKELVPMTKCRGIEWTSLNMRWLAPNIKEVINIKNIGFEGNLSSSKTK